MPLSIGEWHNLLKANHLRNFFLEFEEARAEAPIVSGPVYAASMTRKEVLFTLKWVKERPRMQNGRHGPLWIPSEEDRVFVFPFNRCSAPELRNGDGRYYFGVMYRGSGTLIPRRLKHLIPKR